MARNKKPNLPAGRALNANEFHTVTPEILALASSASRCRDVIRVSALPLLTI